MTNAKLSAILLVATLGWIAVLYYPTPSRIKDGILRSYASEIQSLSGSIEANRKTREKIYLEWKQQDESLSGSINAEKARSKKLTICLAAQSMDCEKWKQEAMLSLIPQAHAENTSNAERDNATPRSGIPERSQAECSIGTGSHDVRSLAKDHPGVAGWKNNNPSGITLGSKELERAFDSVWVLWYVGTARPAREWSNYYGFLDLENGMRAKLLIVKRSYKGSSIASYLRVWGTDAINTHLDTSRLIASLSDDDLLSLMKGQIRKESGSLSEYIFDNVIICQ